MDEGDSIRPASAMKGVWTWAIAATITAMRAQVNGSNLHYISLCRVTTHMLFVFSLVLPRGDVLLSVTQCTCTCALG